MPAHGPALLRGLQRQPSAGPAEAGTGAGVMPHEPELLLPFYVAGSLDPEEKGTVEAHLAACSECRNEVIALRSMRTTLRDQVRSAHPPPERLVRLTEPEAGTDATALGDRVHVDACAECGEEIQALRRTDARSHGRPWRTRWWIAAAAGFLLALALAIPASSWLWDDVPVAREPLAVTILPSTRGAPPENLLPGVGPWDLSIVLPSSASSGAYRLEIADERPPGPVVVAAGPIRSEDGRIRYTLSPLESPGSYRLRVYDDRATGGAVYVYHFEVAAAR